MKRILISLPPPSSSPPFQNRFLALQVTFPDQETAPPLSSSHIAHSIRGSLSAHFGLAAAGALGGPLSVKYYSPQSRTVLLRCARVGVETVHAACTLMGEVAGKRCRVDVVGTSGTIKKLEQWVIKRDRREIQVLSRKAKAKARAVAKAKKEKAVKDGP